MAPKYTAPKAGPRPKKDGQTADLYRIDGVDLPYDPELDLDKPKPTPLYPVMNSVNMDCAGNRLMCYLAIRSKAARSPH